MKWRRQAIARSSPTASEAGFSLLELLVAIAIVAMASVLATSSLWMGRQVTERMETAADTNERLVAVQSFITRLLSRAAWRSFSGATHKGVIVAFDGFSSSIRLIGSALSPALPAGLHEYELALAESPQGNTIRLRYALLRTGVTSFDVTRLNRNSTVLRGVTALSFRYLGREPGAAWRADWQGRRSLPRLVRVSLTLQLAGRSRRLEFVAATRLDPALSLNR